MNTSQEFVAKLLQEAEELHSAIENEKAIWDVEYGTGYEYQYDPGSYRDECLYGFLQLLLGEA